MVLGRVFGGPGSALNTLADISSPTTQSFPTSAAAAVAGLRLGAVNAAYESARRRFIPIPTSFSFRCAFRPPARRLLILFDFATKVRWI